MEPAARGREARQARLGARRGGQAAGRPGRARRAHDLLPQVAPRRRADPALRAAAPRGHGPRRPRRADRPLPRRLHADPAARDRAPAGRGRPAGGGGHRRARARHRHRRARRGDVRDLPRHGGEPAPDVGPRRAPRRRAWRCTWPARTRSTSSSAATPTSSSSGRWSGRSSTTSRRRSTSPTWPPPPTSCRSRPRTRTCFGERWEQHAQRLVKQGRLRERGGRYLPRGAGYPAAEIALRSAVAATRWRSSRPSAAS